MKVKVKRLSTAARLPTYATDGSGCFDLYATHGANLDSERPAAIGTGLSFEIPEGHVMLVFSRSGHGFNHDVRLANCVGVIDSDYRGEVKVKLTCDDYRKSLVVSEGDRVAQALIIPIPAVEFEEVGDLSVTERGEGGFGSTG